MPSTLKLSPATLKAFAGDVWQDMHPHPYHNFSHATDVAQSFYSILIATRLVKSLDAITVATAILAALCHDLDHPGYTNQYQENERTEFWWRPVHLNRRVDAPDSLVALRTGCDIKNQH